MRERGASPCACRGGGRCEGSVRAVVGLASRAWRSRATRFLSASCRAPTGAGGRAAQTRTARRERASAGDAAARGGTTQRAPAGGRARVRESIPAPAATTRSRDRAARAHTRGMAAHSVRFFVALNCSARSSAVRSACSTGATTGGEAAASERTGARGAREGMRWRQRRVHDNKNKDDEGGALESGGVSVRTDRDGEVGCDITTAQTGREMHEHRSCRQHDTSCYHRRDGAIPANPLTRTSFPDETARAAAGNDRFPNRGFRSEHRGVASF